MSSNLASFGLALFLAASTTPGALSGAEASPTAATKKVFAAMQDSVVGVAAVIKVTFNAESIGDMAVNIPEREQKMETAGTLIDAAGMVVTALSTLDPSRELTGREIRTPKGPVKLEASATLKEVKVTMPDGTEIPAEIIMKDADLDLAFIQIKTESKEAKGVAFRAVNLQQSAKVGVGDEVISLGRMDEVLNRQASAYRGSVIALTHKPREFLRISGASAGCPTFSLEGQIVGIAANRSLKGKNPVTVLVPAADVLEIADQAKAARSKSATTSEKKE